MRYLILALITLPALAAQHRGSCSRKALSLALKGHPKAVTEYSIPVPEETQPGNLETYEIGYREKERLYQCQVAVEIIRGRCAKSEIQFVTAVD